MVRRPRRAAAVANHRFPIHAELTLLAGVESSKERERDEAWDSERLVALN